MENFRTSRTGKLRSSAQEVKDALAKINRLAVEAVAFENGAYGFDDHDEDSDGFPRSDSDGFPNDFSSSDPNSRFWSMVIGDSNVLDSEMETEVEDEGEDEDEDDEDEDEDEHEEMNETEDEGEKDDEDEELEEEDIKEAHLAPAKGRAHTNVHAQKGSEKSRKS